MLNNTENAQQIKKLYRMADNQVEVLELSADEFSRFGVTLKDMARDLQPNVLVAAIIRKGVVQIPDGDSTIEKGDKVIIISASDVRIQSLDDILQGQ